MKSIKIAVLLVVLLMVGGCASVQYKELSALPSVHPGKGLTYFYRESKLLGGAVSYYIYEGDEENKIKHGALKRGTFFFIHVEPGTHTYWAKTGAKDAVTLEVEVGQTYYVRGAVEPGFIVIRPKLTIVHEMEGKPEIPELKYAVVEN